MILCKQLAMQPDATVTVPSYWSVIKYCVFFRQSFLHFCHKGEEIGGSVSVITITTIAESTSIV